MKKISVFAVSLSLGLAAFSVPAVSQEQGQYKVEFKVPDYINTSSAPTIQAKIKIITPDGKPFNGPVRLYTPGATSEFADSRNKTSIDTNVVNGEASVRIKLENFTEEHFHLSVCKLPISPLVELGEAEIPVHYVKSYDFLPEESRLAVPADGKTPATLLVRIKDEEGNPMKGVLLKASDQVQTTRESTSQKYMYATTDSKGIAKFVYPPTKISQFATTQIVVPYKNTGQVCLATSSVVLFYQDKEKPKMVSLKKAIERVNGATYTWDSASRTVTVKGVGDYPGHTMTFKEGMQFVRDGQMVWAIEAPIQRDGDSILAPEFAGWQNWVQ